MASAIPQERLAEIVRDARARTGVPAVAAGLLVGDSVELAADGPVEVETPFRVASITKWFTASLTALCLDLRRVRRAGVALAYSRLPARVRRAAARGVSRALVVLERGLLGCR